MNPTARSLNRLRQLGFLCDVVERWLPHANVRRDLFRIADVLAVHPRDGLFLLVQATTASNMAARLAKVRARPELALWLKAGGIYEVHGWALRNGRWSVRVVAVQAGDLGGMVLAAPRPRRRRLKGERQRELFA